jgi:SAM-dependent methyltransferase
MSRDNVPTSEQLDEPDRIVKAGDPEGAFGTTARYWINQHLPELARAHFAGARRVLDLGCGDGPNAALLVAGGLAGDYLGVDLAASPLWAERSGRHGALNVRFTTHDAHRIGDLDEDFDAMVSVSAFEHFRDHRAVMEGLARRLRRGARGIVIVPSPYGNLVWGFRHGYRTYTPARMGRLLDGTSLRLVQSIPSGSLPSLVANSAWRATSLALTYTVLGAVWARHGGDRTAAKARSPWISTLAGAIQFGHLDTEVGRAIHRSLNHGLHDLDERIPGFPTQWVFVIERS